eukprot:gene13208-15219_t
MPIGAQKLLCRGTEDLLTQVSSCLTEQELVPSVLALILAISCNNDGSINPNVSIPSDSLSTFLKCGQPGGNIESNGMNSVSVNLAAPIVTSTDESADNSGYRKKRKFGSVTKQNETVSVPQPISESLLVRHYGSKRSNPGDSQTSMSQTSLAGSVSGSSQNDDYWTDDCFLAPPSAVYEPLLKQAAIEGTAVSAAASPSLTAPVVAPAGGFHRKRKLGNGNGSRNTDYLAVPTIASTSAAPTVSVKEPERHTNPGIEVTSATHGALSQRFPALYSTFMSNKPGHTSPQSTRILHLILLNRYLSARVQALATVKTDMFLSTDNTDPDTEACDTQNTSTNNGMEPHETANSNYDCDYRAQAESLTQVQAVMRIDGDDEDTSFLDSACFRCPQNQSYLATYSMEQTKLGGPADSIPSTLSTALTVFLQHNTSKLLAQVLLQHEKELALRTWKHKNQSGGNINNNNHNNTNCYTSPAGSIGRFGTPIVSSQTQHNPNTSTNSNISSTTCPNARQSRHNPNHTAIPPSTGRSTASTTNPVQPLLPPEWEKFRNLFPEIPVLLSTQTSHKLNEGENGPMDGYFGIKSDNMKTKTSVQRSMEIDTIDSGGSQWEDDDPLELTSPFNLHSSSPALKQTTVSSSKINTPVRSPLFASINGAGGSTTKTSEANEVEPEGEKEVRAVVGLSEVCTAALKALVSLSNDCEDAVQALLLHPTSQSMHTQSSVLATSQRSSQLSTSSSQRSPLPSQLQLPSSSTRVGDTSNSDHSAMGTVPWAVAMLAWCAAWRCSLANSTANYVNNDATRAGKNGKERVSKNIRCVRGALSPDETALERFVFDLMLYLQSFLTNIAEFDAHTITTTVVWPCLSHKSTTASDRQKHASLHALRVPDLLVEILHLEAIDFLVDLEETDAAINNNQPQLQHQGAAQPSPQPLQRTISTTSAPGSAVVAAGKVSESNMPVPVAELIVSAHAALLLHTLTCSTNGVQGNHSVNDVDQRCIESAGINSPGGSVVPSPARSSQQNMVTMTAQLEQHNLAAQVRSKLPRGNWWLCVRVLKAFLTLQGQTGIMLLENLSPVLSAVQSMTKQDNPQSCLALPAASASVTVSLHAVKEHFDSPEIPKALLNPPASASVSKINNRNAHKNHNQVPGDSEQQSALKRALDMPGKIDFLDLWAEEAPAKRAAVLTDTERVKNTLEKSAAPRRETAGGQVQGEWVWNGRDYVWQSAAADDLDAAVQRSSQTPSVSSAARGDSLYKASFKLRQDADSVSDAGAALSSKPASSVEAPVLAALPRSKFSGTGHFVAAEDEEIDKEQDTSSGLSAESSKKSVSPVAVVRATAASNRAQSPRPSACMPAGAASTTVDISHSTGVRSIASVTSDGNLVPAKETAGFRAKRKTFGALPVPVQQAPQDWLE